MEHVVFTIYQKDLGTVYSISNLTFGEFGIGYINELGDSSYLDYANIASISPKW